MDYIEKLLIVGLIGGSNFLTFCYAAMRIDKKIKESEDKIWEYLKLKDITKPVNTSSGLTRKF